MPKVCAGPFMGGRMVEAALGVKVPFRVVEPSPAVSPRRNAGSQKTDNHSVPPADALR